MKSLRVSGQEFTEIYLKKLPLCQKMEKLEISCAYFLGLKGFNSIKQLRNLRSLELSFASRTDTKDGKPTGLGPKQE